MQPPLRVCVVMSWRWRGVGMICSMTHNVVAASPEVYRLMLACMSGHICGFITRYSYVVPVAIHPSIHPSWQLLRLCTDWPCGVHVRAVSTNSGPGAAALLWQF